MPMNRTTMHVMEKLDDIQSAVAALRCLGELIADAVLHEAGALDRLHHEGLRLLLDLPIRDLEANLVGLAETQGIYSEGQRGWRYDAQLRAERGFVSEPDAPEASAEGMDRLRHADFGRIARAVHIEEATVRHVVDRLLAESGAPDAPSSRAVNG